MAMQPLRRCTYPGCRQRVKSGRCDEHRREARREQDSRRGSRRERGYTHTWDKYRLIYLRANPLCVHCFGRGTYTPATVVDHIIPINGGSDVLFWPEFNHQALCHTCHNMKTFGTDPVTKQRRSRGEYQGLESKAEQYRTGE